MNGHNVKIDFEKQKQSTLRNELSENNRAINE